MRCQYQCSSLLDSQILWEIWLTQSFFTTLMKTNSFRITNLNAMISVETLSRSKNMKIPGGSNKPGTYCIPPLASLFLKPFPWNLYPSWCSVLGLKRYKMHQMRPHKLPKFFLIVNFGLSKIYHRPWHAIFWHFHSIRWLCTMCCH